ncbi:hypothetical protein PC123_g10797 [Phytophthora cactorum]|nr:hypothetical protein PC120_g11201 [Phytophthora cactorum]KAG4054071.1 hypothetical protein PC123_g10797 [Phytophthora cactorum]
MQDDAWCWTGISSHSSQRFLLDPSAWSTKAEKMSMYAVAKSAISRTPMVLRSTTVLTTKPDYIHCDAVATEILRLKRAHPSAKVCVMAGDVASVFRNICIHNNSVYLFAGQIEEDDIIVIELSAPFGWTGSPGFYEIAGGAIAPAHGTNTNAECSGGFFNYH